MIEAAVVFVVVWVLSAAALMIIDRLEIGLSVGGFQRAIVAALVLAIVDLLLGTALQLVAWPIEILTCGLFDWLITWAIAAIVLYVTSMLVEGFEIASFLSAVVVALVMAVLSWFTNLFIGPLFG
ncbi:MAG: phage holin family protein [Anaerolineae bacterium]